MLFRSSAESVGALVGFGGFVAVPAVGVLVGTWMASGTVPVMIYYGMKVLTPGLFLPVVCILCTLMSTMAGTSWGTLATVGVACMGVAQGLGVPLPAAAGAVCTGAFFGDKVSPLSDSPVITATVCEVPLMDGIRHALISTGPAYLISLVFYFVYGLAIPAAASAGKCKRISFPPFPPSSGSAPCCFCPCWSWSC